MRLTKAAWVLLVVGKNFILCSEQIHASTVPAQSSPEGLYVQEINSVLGSEVRKLWPLLRVDPMAQVFLSSAHLSRSFWKVCDQKEEKTPTFMMGYQSLDTFL